MLNLLSKFLGNPKIVGFTFGIGIFVSLLNFVRCMVRWWLDEDKNTAGKTFVDRVWEGFTNFFVQFLGFLLIFISFELLTNLQGIENNTTLLLYIILFCILFFYGAFCITGRGIEIILPVINVLREGNITKLELFWGALRIHIGKKEKA